MGSAMARSLRREGHDVVAWNRTAAKAEPLAADGIEVVANVADAVTGADAVITMLFDTDATLSVKDELVAALSPDAVWLQAGTVGPDGAKRLAEGVDRFVDAPVAGTKAPAESGTLVVLASGRPDLIEQAGPVLDAIGSKVVRAGEQIGQGSALKLVVNSWVALMASGIAQSMAFARALGLDPALFLEALDGGPTSAPYVNLKGQNILNGDYATSFAVDGVVKDVGLMIETARAAGFPTELLATVRDLYAAASDSGHGGDDMAAVTYAFEH